MGVSVRVVTSVANRPGMAWQAVVFAHAWRPYLSAPPMVVVNARDGEPLLAEFGLIDNAGTGEVVRVRDRADDGPWYPARNAPGALLEAPGDAELTVLCDGDLLPVGPVDFATFGAAPGRPTLDIGPCGPLMLFPGGSEDDWLPGACDLLGVAHASLASRPCWGGVPHVVHRDDRRRLASAWLDVDRRVGEENRAAVRGPYSMWTFILASLSLGMRPLLTNVSGRAWEGAGMRTSDHDPGEPLIVHYYNADAGFSKGDHEDHPPGAAARVWDVRPVTDPPATLTDVVRGAIRAAAAFHGLDDPARRRRMLVDGDPGAALSGRAPRGVPVGDVVGNAEGRPGDGVGDEADVGPGLAEQGGVVGLHEGAAGVDVQLRRDQERVGQRGGREAHVSRLVLPEPRLRRARGRRRRLVKVTAGPAAVRARPAARPAAAW